MSERSEELVRTHTCGALRVQDIGAEVVLAGWVHKVRDLGGLTFVDLRDRDGVTQVVAREGDPVHAAVKRLRAEFVVAVAGPVERRSEETLNPKIATGEVEVAVRTVTVLSEARTPPFQIDEETPVSEETRLRYRYLDLRRARMRANLGLRHRVAMAVRISLDAEGFWEIETPLLTKSTPEGARGLPGAEPAARRPVLRVAAVAADLQADPDDRRHGSLLSDRQVLSRRGPARGPAAGVHAGRHRAGLRERGPGLRHARAPHAGRFPAGRQGGAGAVSAPLLRRRHGALRQRQARPALRDARAGRLRRLPRRRVQGVSRDRGRRRLGARPGGAGRRPPVARADRQPGRRGAGAGRERAGLGAAVACRGDPELHPEGRRTGGAGAGRRDRGGRAGRPDAHRGRPGLRGVDPARPVPPAAGPAGRG